VIDTQGEQVADLFCVDHNDLTDGFSAGRSIDYNDSIRLTTGSLLLSNAGSPLLRIAKDTCGTHDVLVSPCSLQMFQMVDPECMYHPSCQENLIGALRPFGVKDHVVASTFNIFMNVEIDHVGRIEIRKPLSKPGDSITFEAQRELIVGLSACAHEGTNNGICKPIVYEILRSNQFAQAAY
jgi:uncharacterized protein YcgI (DUF1989 family)